VFEDAPSHPASNEAALNADMSVVMIPDSNLDRSLCGKASQVLGSMEEFDLAAWGLPAYHD
jgi:hypothetical protein